MDKRIVYAGAIPVDLDWLEPQRNAELALGYLMQAAFGTSTLVDGLAVTQQASPNMTVQVGTGSIITYTTVDPTGVAYGAMALNSTNLVKIGINATAVNMSALTAPAIAGQSQNWLLEAKFLEADGSAVVLPYFNASNPTLPYTGPANAGTTQNTRRTNTVSLQWKAGTAATTGTQATPTPDSGWVGIAIVTVANGQATITNSNIAPYVATPVVPTKLPNLRQKLTANLTVYVAPTGSDSNSGLASWNPFATLQKAWNYISSTLDLNGFSVTVSVANGTYTGALTAVGAITGLSAGNSVSFVGNTGSPSSVVISVTNAHAITVAKGAVVSFGGMLLQASGTAVGGASGLLVTQGGNVTINGAMAFGSCVGSHMWAGTGGLISSSGQSFTISGGAAAHYNSSGGGTVNLDTLSVTLTGTPAFSSAFALAGYGFTQITGLTIASGTATGQRYLATLTGAINTSGGGASYVPGSVAGSTATGGQYA